MFNSERKIRFIHSLKNENTRSSDILSVEEITQSLTCIVSTIIKRYFAKELHQLSENKTLNNNTLLSLKIFLESNDLIRIGGELQNANIPYKQKHLTLLPANDYVSLRA